MRAPLDAGCVFKHLARMRIIEAEDWRRPKATRYSVRFYHGDTNGTLEFDVTVKDGSHLVEPQCLDLLAWRYHIDLSAIYAECAVA